MHSEVTLNSSDSEAAPPCSLQGNTLESGRQINLLGEQLAFNKASFLKLSQACVCVCVCVATLSLSLSLSPPPPAALGSADRCPADQRVELQAKLCVPRPVLHPASRGAPAAPQACLLACLLAPPSVAAEGPDNFLCLRSFNLTQEAPSTKTKREQRLLVATYKIHAGENELLLYHLAASLPTSLIAITALTMEHEYEKKKDRQRRALR